MQTRYTVAADPGPGWLCHVCAKKSGIDPFKKAAAPRKRKALEEKRKLVSYEERELPTLASLCISVSRGPTVSISGIQSHVSSFTDHK